MTQRTRDGGTVPSHLNQIKQPGGEEHYQLFGLKRGYVQRVVPANDPNNLTGRLEYVVTIGGQDYPGVIDITGPGGIYQNHTRVRKGADWASLSGRLFDSAPSLPGMYEEKKDGEIVFCMFINGNGDMPVIIGGDEHPMIKSLNPDYHEPDGLFDRFEYNGLEFLIDPDGNYTIKHLGLKVPPNPLPVNPHAVGGEFKLSKDGDFSYITQLGTKIQLTNTSDKVEVSTALGASVKVEGANVTVNSSGGNVDVTGALGVSAKDVTGAGINIGTGKVAVGNSVGEIFALLEEVVTALSTCTAAGFGAPISLVGQMPAILAKIAAVKGSL